LEPPGAVFRHQHRHGPGQCINLHNTIRQSNETRQVRLASTLALWVTIDSTAVVTANTSAALIPANVPEYFAVTPGQVLNFISTSTSTGYVSLSEMS
jgi:hypothetical protein